jgi:hypothetical protein
MRHNWVMFTKPALPILITILVISVPALVWAEGIISEPPEQIEFETHYVFYLHGQIVQELGPRPIQARGRKNMHN